MKIRSMLVALALAAGAGGLALVAMPAQATVTPNTDPCKVGTSWFVNGDEGERTPTRTIDGFVFEETDLIHHAAPTGLTVEALENGAYTASPAPDQPSFFSVEVSDSPGGYATLRWDPLNHKWQMTTGGQFYENTSAKDLVDSVTPHKSHHVITFGVGYTKTPPGTVKTTVKSVSFAGQVYRFNCSGIPTHRPPTRPTHKPTATVTPTATATVTPTTRPTTTAPTTRPVPTATTATPTPSVSISSPPIIGVSNNIPSGGLPLTGPGVASIFAVGGGALLIGLGVVVLMRRRKTNFTT
jgi:LPXTG-motif cell wall-anchored protein